MAGVLRFTDRPSAFTRILLATLSRQFAKIARYNCWNFGRKVFICFSFFFLPCLALPRCNDERSCAEIIVHGIIKAAWNGLAWIRWMSVACLHSDFYCSTFCEHSGV